MFYDNLKQLCIEKKTSPSAVAIGIGMSKSNVTGWKKGQEPGLSTIVKIAAFLGVDTSTLIDSDQQTKENVQSYYDGYKDGLADSQKLDLNRESAISNEKEKLATISDDELDNEIIRLIKILRGDNQKAAVDYLRFLVQKQEHGANQ